jgi:hypothetical protein
MLALAVFSFASYGLVNIGSLGAEAHSSNAAVSSDLPHEVDHTLAGAVYTTTGGWSSSLLLLNAEGKSITARVRLYNKRGAALTVPDITLEPYKNSSWNIADWIGNADGFETGSIEVLYHGLSMGLHAQETVTNQSQSLSFDVHFEEAMEFMSSTVDGLWWALDDKTDAQVFVANTKVAQTIVTPTFYVGGLAHQGEQIVLNGHESDVIDINKELKKLNLSATIGGISLTYTSGPGSLSAKGVISNKRTGFSTTMRFVDHMMGSTASLHGANIMIGKQESNSGFLSTTRFRPHAVVRNVTDSPVQVHGRIRYSLLGQPNTSELNPVTLAANEVRELDLNSTINAIGGSAVTDAGIELEYAAQPGAVMAYAASVDQTGSNAFDVPIKDPKEMVFKGGANPWRIDGNNRAVLHVKNVNIPDGQKHEFTVSIYYDGGVYNLPVQTVEAGQTAEIDIKKLRDDQVLDGSGNLIPLTATSGQLSWYPRAKKGDFIGRMVQYDPVAGTASSFSCDEPCWCGPDYGTSWLSPGSFNGVPGDVFQVHAYEVDYDCHGWPHGPYLINYANFYSTNPFVAYVVYPNYVVLADGGSVYIIGAWDSQYTAGETCDQWDWASGWCEVPNCDMEPTPAGGATQVNSVQINSITPSANLWWFGGYSPSGYATSITLSANVSPQGGSFQWTITAGTSIVQFSNNSSSATGNPVTLNSIGATGGINDVTVSLTYTANSQSVTRTATLSVRAPYQLVSTGPDSTSSRGSDCTVPGNQGWLSLIHYKVVNQFNETVGNVGLHESVSKANDVIFPNNWTFTEGGIPLLGSSATFDDRLCVTTSAYTPAPLPAGNGSDLVDQLNQAWYIGTGTVGANPTGVDVQINLINRYLDHGTHFGISSPPGSYPR